MTNKGQNKTINKNIRLSKNILFLNFQSRNKCNYDDNNFTVVLM